MKTKIEDNKGTRAEGNFKITIGNNNGSVEIIRHTQMLDPYALTRMIEKCEIAFFKVELEAIGE